MAGCFVTTYRTVEMSNSFFCSQDYKAPMQKLTLINKSTLRNLLECDNLPPSPIYKVKQMLSVE